MPNKRSNYRDRAPVVSATAASCERHLEYRMSARQPLSANIYYARPRR